MFRRLLAFWRGASKLPEAIPVESPTERVEQVQHSERGQSLIEYTILLTWMTLASIAIIHGVGDATKRAWSTANSNLTQANTTSH